MKMSLTEIYQLLIESKKSEAEARNVVARLDPYNYAEINVDALIENLVKIDSSVNQKNLPVLAYFAVRMPVLVYEDLKDTFDKYNILLEKNKIKPLSFTKDGVEFEGKVYDQLYYFESKIKSIFEVVRTEEDNEEEEITVEDAKPIFKNDKVEIYDANSIGSCIHYTVGQGLTNKEYSFCIGQKRNTRHQGYRDVQTSSFYYILDKTRDVQTDPLHIVVYDNTRIGVQLTDEKNTTGTIAEFGQDVAAYQKYLKGLGVDYEKLMPNIPYTPEEEWEINNFKHQEGSLKWFQQQSYKDKKRYIGRGHALSDEQFDFLVKYNAKELLQDYADAHAIFNEHQLSQLNGNLLKTYFRRRFQQYEADMGFDIKDHEIQFITPSIFKGYLYVTRKKRYGYIATELREKLPEKLLLMYWELHFAMGNAVSNEELMAFDPKIQMMWAKALGQGEQYFRKEVLFNMPKEVQAAFFEEYVQHNDYISDDILKVMPQQYRNTYFQRLLQNGYEFSNYDLRYVDKDLQEKILLKRVSTGNFIMPEDIKEYPPHIQKAYFEARIKKGELFKGEIEGMSEEIQKMYWSWALENDNYVELEDIKDFGDDMIEKYYVQKIKNDRYFTKDEISQLPEKIQVAILKAKIEKGEYISREEIESFPQDVREYYYTTAIDQGDDPYIPKEELKKLPKEYMLKYYDNLLDGEDLPFFYEKDLLTLPKKIVNKYLEKKIKNNDYLMDYEKEMLTKKQKLLLKLKELDRGYYLDDDEFKKVPLKYKRKHNDNLIKDRHPLNDVEFAAATPKQQWATIKQVIDDGGSYSRRFPEHLISDKLMAKIKDYLG